jgi:hypothetical protein
MSKVMHELMRHANISTTMNVCAKALTPARREVQKSPCGMFFQIAIKQSRNIFTFPKVNLSIT